MLTTLPHRHAPYTEVLKHIVPTVNIFTKTE